MSVWVSVAISPSCISCLDHVGAADAEGLGDLAHGRAGGDLERRLLVLDRAARAAALRERAAAAATAAARRALGRRAAHVIAAGGLRVDDDAAALAAAGCRRAVAGRPPGGRRRGAAAGGGLRGGLRRRLGLGLRRRGACGGCGFSAAGAGCGLLGAPRQRRRPPSASSSAFRATSCSTLEAAALTSTPAAFSAARTCLLSRPWPWRSRGRASSPTQASVSAGSAGSAASARPRARRRRLGVLGARRGSSASAVVGPRRGQTSSARAPRPRARLVCLVGSGLGGLGLGSGSSAASAASARAATRPAGASSAASLLGRGGASLGGLGASASGLGSNAASARGDDRRDLVLGGVGVGEHGDLLVAERREDGDLVGLEAGQRLVLRQAAVAGAGSEAFGQRRPAESTAAQRPSASSSPSYSILVLLRTNSVSRLDVDAPAGQLGGEAGVLALAADRQRELVVGHDDGRLLVSSSTSTSRTRAGESALATKRAGSSL